MLKLGVRKPGYYITASAVSRKEGMRLLLSATQPQARSGTSWLNHTFLNRLCAYWLLRNISES